MGLIGRMLGRRGRAAGRAEFVRPNEVPWNALDKFRALGGSDDVRTIVEWIIASVEADTVDALAEAPVAGDSALALARQTGRLNACAMIRRIYEACANGTMTDALLQEVKRNAR